MPVGREGFLVLSQLRIGGSRQEILSGKPKGALSKRWRRHLSTRRIRVATLVRGHLVVQVRQEHLVSPLCEELVVSILRKVSEYTTRKQGVNSKQ